MMEDEFVFLEKKIFLCLSQTLMLPTPKDFQNKSSENEQKLQSIMSGFDRNGYPTQTKKKTALSNSQIGLGVALGVGVTGAVAVAMMWRVAKPSEYLVRTGLFINDAMGMSVSRKGFLLPGQALQRVVMKLPPPLSFLFSSLSLPFSSR